MQHFHIYSMHCKCFRRDATTPECVSTAESSRVRRTRFTCCPWLVDTCCQCAAIILYGYVKFTCWLPDPPRGWALLFWKEIKATNFFPSSICIKQANDYRNPPDSDCIHWQLIIHACFLASVRADIWTRFAVFIGGITHDVQPTASVCWQRSEVLVCCGGSKKEQLKHWLCATAEQLLCCCFSVCCKYTFYLSRHPRHESTPSEFLDSNFPRPPARPCTCFSPFFHSLYCSESGMACVFHHRNRHNTPAQPSLGSTNRPNKINHSVGVCKSLFSSLHSTSNRMRRVRARLCTFLTSFWCWSQTQFDIKQKQSHTSAPNISADGDFIFVFNMTCSDCPRPIHITCWDRTLLCLWRNLMIRRVKTRCYEINLFF